MRAVIQRVSASSVMVDEETIGQIGGGVLVLLGVDGEDTPEEISWLVGKVARLRIFADEGGLMNRSLMDVGGEVLVISQFTLHASTKKGNRPSYIRAARPEVAEPLYVEFVRQLTSVIGRPVETGKFGADMAVSLINDGPVTIFIDTKNRE